MHYENHVQKYKIEHQARLKMRPMFRCPNSFSALFMRVKLTLPLNICLNMVTPTLLRRVYKCVLKHTCTLRRGGACRVAYEKIFSLIFGIKIILFSKKSHALLEQKMNAKLSHNFGTKNHFQNFCRRLSSEKIICKILRKLCKS